MKVKIIAALASLAALSSLVGGAYFIGRSHERAECEQERAQAIADAVRIRTEALKKKARRAEERLKEEKEERERIEQRGEEREEEIDEYLDQKPERDSAICLGDGELLLFNESRTD